MITGEIKSQVDQLWDAFWTGGISNPLSVVEQITYLLFMKRLDDLHTLRERKANRIGQAIEKPIFGPEQEHLRWSRFKQLDAQSMFERVSQEVFPFIKGLHQSTDSAFSSFMKDAAFLIPKPSLLQRVVDMIDAIPMHDRDTKGDLYEYLLAQLTTSGKNGQFRTPRHIIQMMVEMMRPTPQDTICDPSCGTAGFLVGAEEYLRQKHPEILHDSALKAHFDSDMFHGFDFDASMLRIAAMNLTLHGIEHPQIVARDSLSKGGEDVAEAFSLVLANPPFKGSLDYDEVARDLLQTVKTKKTELLFMALILRILKLGGRAAVVLPDGVLFGSSKAHVTLRKEIVDGHKLEAVISMPSGVFKPYAGVSTAILIFTKTGSGGTDTVWFYDMQADGYSLDDKRSPLGEKHSDPNDPEIVAGYKTTHAQNNIPDILARWQKREDEAQRERTEQSFLVPVDEIQSNKYDLSINRYKEIVYEEVEYDPPKVILKELLALEDEIQAGLKELEGMLA